MKRKDIKIHNLNLSYLTNEQNSDNAVLFVHGNSLDSSTFLSQVEDPIFNDFQLIALDLPGHGQSDRASDPSALYNVITLANIVSAYVAALDLKKVVLVGHSLGGHVAIHSTPLLKNLAGLVLFGTPPIGMPPAMDKMFLPNPAMAYAYQPELTQEEANVLAASFTLGTNNLADIIQRTDPGFRGAFGANLAAGIFKNEQEICINLPCPLGIFHGDSDALVNLNYLQGLHFPGMWKDDVQIIQGSGHSPQLEQPEEFNALLITYLKDLNLG
jgi:pimeloyl-ACP methyl ester carboxylesterase